MCAFRRGLDLSFDEIATVVACFETPIECDLTYSESFWSDVDGALRRDKLHDMFGVNPLELVYKIRAFNFVQCYALYDGVDSVIRRCEEDPYADVEKVIRDVFLIPFDSTD